MNGYSNGPRPLHIYYRDGHDRLEVTDSDKQTVLYIVYRVSSKPHLTITRAPTHSSPEALVGQVSFHHISSAIDLNVPESPLTMKKTSKLSSNYEVSGNGIRWRWERDGAMTSDIKLVDAMGGGVLASFENASFSRKKQGTLTLHIATPRHVLDSIVVTGLAKIEYQRRSSAGQSNATGSAAAISFSGA